MINKFILAVTLTAFSVSGFACKCEQKKRVSHPKKPHHVVIHKKEKK